MTAKNWLGIPLVAMALSLGLASASSADDSAVRAEERADLFAALKAAPSQQIADAAVAAIWEHWQTAPDARAQRMLDAARLNMRRADLNGAVDILDALTAYVPDYSEGWNTRATALFMQQKYEASLADVGKVLALEPKHFGALSGKAMILVRQGRPDEAQSVLREAVAIHPFLSERRMLKEP